MTGAPHLRPLALVNARLLDPESGYDGPGSLVIRDGVIADVLKQPGLESPSSDLEVVDCAGALLAPGLIDIRVKTGEPGAETKETLKSAGRAAAAGGVTTMVVQPDTDPAIDDPEISLIQDQVEMGVAVRMAILASLARRLENA